MMHALTIPRSICCKPCKICGARPVLVQGANAEYIVKCPNSDNHYQTRPGLIDITDWNAHNIKR